MNTKSLLQKNVTELTNKECMSIRGGSEVTNYQRCVATTLTSGGGGIRGLILGVGLFGVCRMLGVAVGYMN
jgi:hypothetical protein